jgi:DNA-binding NarL/FixJ family response regulator
MGSVRVRVLLADDHEIVREGLKLLISSQPDMEVVGEAADGRTAVECTVRSMPDVVVMDVSMPGLSGVAAIAEIARRCPQVRVLALSRHSADGYIHQAIRSGASGYVLKQSRPSELLRGIRAVAAHAQFLDPVATRSVMSRSSPRGAARTGSAAPLTVREEEVVRLIARGYSNKEVAHRLDISVKTVETHKANAMQKLGMTNRHQLVHFAYLQGWFDAA